MTRVLHISFAAILLLLNPNAHAATATPDRITVKHARKVHAETQYTALCHLPIQDHTHILMPNHSLLPPAATRVRWGYLIGLERYGRLLGCWQSTCLINGKARIGHPCCRQTSAQYAALASDLRLIAPLLAKAATVLQRYQVGVVRTASEVWPGCGAQLDHVEHRLEPPNNAKGVLARAYLYAYHRHGYPLSAEEMTLFSQWAKEYPEAAWEQAWHNEIILLQG